MPEWTNLESYFDKCGLDKNIHRLWATDRPPPGEPGKIIFWCNNEGKAAINKSKLQSGSYHLFDSVVSDDGAINPYMLHWFQVVSVDQRYNFSKKIKPVESGLVFDALLGQLRLHRDFAYSWFDAHPDVKNQGYITYYKRAGNANDFHVDDDVDLTKFIHSGIGVDYHGQFIPPSQIIPVQIYSQTWVSVVTETYRWGQDWSFFTEKIAKPMLCKRPFIVLANKGYLRRLRSFGFETFASVIDESYDTIDNDQERWGCALEQLKIFLDVDKNIVLSELDKTLEHNKSIIQQCWMETFMKRVKKLS